MSTETATKKEHSGHGIDYTVDELFDELNGAAQPNATLNRVRPDLERATPRLLEGYDGKPVDESKLEEATNKVSELFVKALYKLNGERGPNVDSPELYGTMVRDMLNKVSQEAFGQFKKAIKDGDREEVLRLLKEAYEAQSSLIPSIVSRIQGQPSNVQMQVYQRIADALSGGKGDLAKVATNVPGAVDSMRRHLAIQDAYSTKEHKYN